MRVAEYSERLANSISAELGYSEEQKDIIAYGIESSILAVFGFGVVLITAFFLNALFPAAIATIFGGILRKVSGGAHFNTPIKCLVIGAITYSFLGVIAIRIVEYNLFSTVMLLALLVLSLIVVTIYSPVDSEAKPLHSLSFKKKLKAASIIIVVLSLVIVLVNDNALFNTSAVLGVTCQTITLLPVLNNKQRR